jgi:peptide chain release factor subunit 1
LHKFSVDLPKKHGRGGQSALRFARLRLEKRHNYVRKVAELTTSLFITNDRPNVSGLVLAGSAEFKQKLSISEMFDQRLSAIVTEIVDVSYGAENGFNQAIELSADSLANVKFIREKKLLANYFGEISKDTGRYCFGVADTLHCLELGAISDLIVWENLDITRYTLENPITHKQDVKHLSKTQERNVDHFHEDGVELDIKEQLPLLEWLTNEYKTFGAKIQFVTNKSQEGSQFVKGFGGIGGLLRYEVDMAVFDEPDDDDYNDDFEL